MSREIWNHPETAYKEVFASGLQKKFLEGKGFREEEKGSVPNAIYMSRGTGKPVIGFMGEYDALAGLSQIEDGVTPCEAVPGGAGHGCGHHMLGTACLQAAVMTAEYLEEQGLPGTVVYLGCPGEESGAGKAFMLREQYFDDIDFAFTWHPSSYTGMMRGTLANIRVSYKFHGVSSHASAAPWEGRSALDACELTNVGVNYLREHVRPEVRMHYAYLNSGGTAPNIVPSDAGLIYALRAPEDEMLSDLLERVTNVAKGAALMTGTTLESKVLTYYGSVMGVPSLDELIYSVLKEKTPISYTEEELEYAGRYSQTETDNMDHHLLGFLESGSAISTDAGNVSQKIPLGVFHVTAMTKNTSLHTWMATAQGLSSIAMKGMHTAACVMAESALLIFGSQNLQEKIKKEFLSQKKKLTYGDLFPETTTIEDVKAILP